MARKIIRYDLYNDFYARLNIPTDAPIEMIHRAYRQQAKAVHPDLNPGREVWATEQFRLLNDAYDVLTDPLQRAAYDRQRRRVYPNEPYQGDDYWTRSHAPTGGETPPPTFDAEAAFESWRQHNRTTTSTGAVYRTAFRNIMTSPYRYVVYLLALVLIVNFVFIGLVGITRIQEAQARIPTSSPTNVPPAIITAAFVYRVATVEANAPKPTCTNPHATITFPVEGAALNFDAFDIRGSADPENFFSYLLEVEYLDSASITRPRWVLQTPIRKPITEGVLAKGATISNLFEGRYLLRLTVTLEGGETLPPCEVTIVRKL